MTDSLLDNLDTHALDLLESEEITLDPANNKLNNANLKRKKRRSIEDYLEEKRLENELKDYDFDL